MSERAKRNVNDVMEDMKTIKHNIKNVREYADIYVKDAKLTAQLDSMITAVDKTVEYVKGRLDHADQPKR